VRLFLASSDLSFPPRGDLLAAELAELVGVGARTAVVLNALDDVADLDREARLEHERRGLESLGTAAFELDLRAHYEQPAGLSGALGGVGLVWAVGGNALALRAAMVRSGLDTLLVRLLAEDSVVYGGYSAGACVAGPALRGVDLFDDRAVGEEPVWGGLALVDFSIVPHYGSGGSEGHAFERIAAHLHGKHLAYRVLRNGQAIIVAGGSVTLHE
jgi:dipeptidase E